MVIKIKNLVGEYCSQRSNGSAKKGGEYIREMILQSWDKEKNIEISFDGVKLATPSFLDEAFGKLVLDHSLEQLREKLVFEQVDEATKNKINKGIELRLKQKQANVK